jgi:hypothetical protein
MEMLTIKGKSTDEVMKIARTVDGFTVDEQYGAILINPSDELYVVRGTVTKAITDQRVEGIWADPKIGVFGP